MPGRVLAVAVLTLEVEFRWLVAQALPVTALEVEFQSLLVAQHMKAVALVVTSRSMQGL